MRPSNLVAAILQQHHGNQAHHVWVRCYTISRLCLCVCPSVRARVVSVSVCTHILYVSTVRMYVHMCKTLQLLLLESLWMMQHTNPQRSLPLPPHLHTPFHPGPGHCINHHLPQQLCLPMNMQSSVPLWQHLLLLLSSPWYSSPPGVPILIIPLKIHFPRSQANHPPLPWKKLPTFPSTQSPFSCFLFKTAVSTRKHLTTGPDTPTWPFLPPVSMHPPHQNQ